MSTELRIFETPVGASSNTIGPKGAGLDLLGLKVIAMPPGRVELEMANVVPMLVVSPTWGAPAEVFDMRVDGQRFPVAHAGPGRFDVHAPTNRLQLECINYG
ncbi:hypothetical protein [Jannaschia aquimarina]|uniref:Uncharacterized protein n=1 Tax=Jannaschia aquimarina TaxID=935700 RepID=A0A0D1EKV6_9RHOB|nr:hypothetical protein [Jannaschia aquimarina]KIT18209.1 hypothetical protein jaqu_00090 [Jannaschia aquimarina]SNS83385.1 hypothetical protein SAMN05421775_102490 [Jannaschia aquimarina]